jgi:TolB protein
MFKLIGAIACVAVLGAGVGVASSAPASTAGSIVYHARLKGANNEIFVVNPKVGVAMRVTRNARSDSNPTWSANGARIAFESNRDARNGRDADVYVMRSDGTGVTPVTFTSAFDGDPAWSRAGRIAFESDRAGNMDVWAINADGSRQRQLTTDRAFDGDPAWSPDGSRVVFTSRRDTGDLELYVMNVDGSGQTRLTSSPGDDQNPSWSPDGRRIAFDSMRDGNLEIYSMSPDGSDVRQVTDHPALDAIPSWAPDSRRLVFVSDRVGKGQRRLYVANADGTGTARLVTKGAFDMSPDWARG